jgi:hypothetical protein
MNFLSEKLPFECGAELSCDEELFSNQNPVLEKRLYRFYMQIEPEISVDFDSSDHKNDSILDQKEVVSPRFIAKEEKPNATSFEKLQEVLQVEVLNLSNADLQALSLVCSELNTIANKMLSCRLKHVFEIDCSNKKVSLRGLIHVLRNVSALKRLKLGEIIHIAESDFPELVRVMSTCLSSLELLDLSKSNLFNPLESGNINYKLYQLMRVLSCLPKVEKN